MVRLPSRVQDILFEVGSTSRQVKSVVDHCFVIMSILIEKRACTVGNNTQYFKEIVYSSVYL